MVFRIVAGPSKHDDGDTDECREPTGEKGKEHHYGHVVRIMNPDRFSIEPVHRGPGLRGDDDSGHGRDRTKDISRGSRPGSRGGEYTTHHQPDGDSKELAQQKRRQDCQPCVLETVVATLQPYERHRYGAAKKTDRQPPDYRHVHMIVDSLVAVLPEPGFARPTAGLNSHR